MNNQELTNEERQALIDESRSEIERMKRILDTGSVAVGWAKCYKKEIMRHEIALAALTENWQERAEAAEEKLAELAKQEPVAFTSQGNIDALASKPPKTLEFMTGDKSVYRDPVPLFTRAAPPAPVKLPDCFQRLLSHAYGMSMGNDWNKGTMAGHHREKLCAAVEECRAEVMRLNAVDNTAQQYEALAGSRKNECGWTFCEDDYYWESECGGTWVFNDGGPVENGVKFCQCCGKPIAFPTSAG